MATEVSEAVRLQPGDALMAVDVQYDFRPHGALGVAQGEPVLAPPARGIVIFPAATAG